MRKMAWAAIMLVFTLVGCSMGSGSDELVAYEKEKVIQSLDELAFNAEIPALLPFEPEEISVNTMEGRNNFLEATFFNENKQKLIYRAGAENHLDFTEETVNINENLEGRYGEDEKFKMLRWNKDEIYYELLVDRDAASKEEVLGVAQNTYQVN